MRERRPSRRSAPGWHVFAHGRLIDAVGTTDLAARMKIELQVANPTHQAWRRRGIKTKTDRADAVKPAQLSSVDQLPQVTLPSKEVRAWRSLIHDRQLLVARQPAAGSA